MGWFAKIDEEKKDKKTTMPDYGGAIFLKDIKRAKDDKEKDKKEN